MTEILHEIVVEIGADPGKFTIEVVQFLMLAAIVYLVAMGFGRRKGMVTSMLAGRRDRVAARVERAAHADEQLARSRAEAEASLEAAKSEAVRIVRESRTAARASRRTQRAAADVEAATIRARAATVLEDERAEMHVEIRDRLVGVVAQSTRALLNEGLSQHEQRELIQNVVSSQVDRLERSVNSTSAVVR